MLCFLYNLTHFCTSKLSTTFSILMIPIIIINKDYNNKTEYLNQSRQAQPYIKHTVHITIYLWWMSSDFPWFPFAQVNICIQYIYAICTANCLNTWRKAFSHLSWRPVKIGFLHFYVMQAIAWIKYNPIIVKFLSTKTDCIDCWNGLQTKLEKALKWWNKTLLFQKYLGATIIAF